MAMDHKYQVGQEISCYCPNGRIYVTARVTDFFERDGEPAVGLKALSCGSCSGKFCNRLFWEYESQLD